MVSALLAVLGSLGGLIIVWNVGRRAYTRGKSLYHGRLSVDQDWYFSQREVSEIFLANGRDSYTIHKSTVVSRVSRLESIRTGWGPASSNEITPAVLEGEITLREIPPEPPSGDWKDFSIDFKRPLGKGESASYTIRVFMRALTHQPGNDRVTVAIARRVDHLTLRAVFAHPPAGPFYAKVFHLNGDLIDQRQVAMDIVTNECNVTFEQARPGRVYAIVWDSRSWLLPTGESSADAVPLLQNPV